MTTRTPKTASCTLNGKTVTGDVVKANGTTVYVKWRTTGRTEPVSRRKPDGVTFKY